MASETSICNSALTRIGAARITSLTDDSKQARACTASYALMRDEVLRSHPWNSAISRASVASLADAPAFGSANARGVRLEAALGGRGPPAAV
jgi:hypothetical protein